jgi:signal peptidase I
MHPSILIVFCAVLALLWWAASTARRRGDQPSSLAWSSCAWLVVGVGLSRLLLWDPVVVQGASMAPTLSNDDLVVVDRSAFGYQLPVFTWRLGSHTPSLGDIVVFKAPDGNRWIKRVAALPGDRLAFVPSIGWFRNDKFLAPLPLNMDDPPRWLVAVSSPVQSQGMAVRQWTLPVDQYFVLGDNLQVSIDSRRIGPVPLTQLDGKVF